MTRNMSIERDYYSTINIGGKYQYAHNNNVNLATIDFDFNEHLADGDGMFAEYSVGMEAGMVQGNIPKADSDNKSPLDLGLRNHDMVFSGNLGGGIGYVFKADKRGQDSLSFGVRTNVDAGTSAVAASAFNVDASVQSFARWGHACSNAGNFTAEIGAGYTYAGGVVQGAENIWNNNHYASVSGDLKYTTMATNGSRERGPQFTVGIGCETLFNGNNTEVIPRASLTLTFGDCAKSRASKDYCSKWR